MLLLPLLLACQPPEDGKDDTSSQDSDTDTDTDDAPPVRATIAVCEDGSADYTTIQAAIDASAPGDSVSVCPGTYAAINVPWSVEVSITSTDGPDATSIDGGGGPAVIVDNGTLTLSGFHVTGTALEDPYYPEAAAFSVHEGDLSVIDCHVTDTTGSFTVLMDENYLVLEDVVWENNTTDYLWYLIEGINADVRHNTVIGGQHQQVVTTADLDNLLMANNSFRDIGVGTAVTAFDFSSNGVGIQTITNNVFYNIDDADPYGGRTVDLNGVVFRNNIVAACDAADLRAMDASYSVFWDNLGEFESSVTGTGNVYADPRFGDAAGGDFSLDSGSPAINAGNPALFDADGSRSDIGRYGGPYEADIPAYEPEDTETITGTVARILTVTDGFGSGSHLAGEVVHVWADLDPQTELVTGWSGATLDHPAEWTSTFTMPDADVTLTPSLATADLPLVETTYTLAGTPRSVLAAIPADPRGLVLFFHSALGDNTEIRDNAPSSIARRLYDAGYGIVAMSSDIAAISGTGGWSDATDDETLDLAATRELVNELAYWDIPTIAWGVGSGAEFAHSLGVALPADAVVAYCAPGRRYLVESTTAPTAWFMAARDSTWPDGDDQAVAYAAGLEARGVTAEAWVHPPTPLYDERFTRVAGISAALSTTIADSLRTAGYVDANDEWLVTGEEAASDLGGLGLTASQEIQVGAEIEIMAADHRLYDDYAAATLAFLNGLFR
ncbi:MAG: hypothetical protein V4850_03565 [Myxococcota bacterium]